MSGYVHLHSPAPYFETESHTISFPRASIPSLKQEKFRERFGVQVIAEFFASSEGNGSLFNYNGNSRGAGAVGHEGTLSAFARRKKQAIVKVDAITEEPARGKDGFCIRVSSVECGEVEPCGRGR